MVIAHRKGKLARLLFTCSCMLSAHCGVAFGAYGDCGQPVTDGDEPTATDALEILRQAVGLESGCENKICICDVNYAGELSNYVTTADALLVLKRAVGEDVVLTCCPE